MHIGCVMCGGVWLNLLSHVGPLRSKQREWEKCTFMWSPNEIISGELVRWGIHYRSASHYRLVLLWSGHPHHSIQLTTLKAESRNKGNGNGYLVQTVRLTVCSDNLINIPIKSAQRCKMENGEVAYCSAFIVAYSPNFKPLAKNNQWQ